MGTEAARSPGPRRAGAGPSTAASPAPAFQTGPKHSPGPSALYSFPASLRRPGRPGGSPPASATRPPR